MDPQLSVNGASSSVISCQIVVMKVARGGYFGQFLLGMCRWPLRPLPYYGRFCRQIEIPFQSLMGKCIFRDPNLVTYCLLIYLVKAF